MKTSYQETRFNKAIEKFLMDKYGKLTVDKKEDNVLDAFLAGYKAGGGFISFLEKDVEIMQSHTFITKDSKFNGLIVIGSNDDNSILLDRYSAAKLIGLLSDFFLPIKKHNEDIEQKQGEEPQ